MWKVPTGIIFAIAESPNGIDNFRFWDYPVTMPEDLIPATNIYDMRLTAHEDAGFMVSSAPNAMMIMHLWVIYLQLLLRPALPVQKT